MKIETVTYKRLMPQCAVHLRTNRLIKNVSVSTLGSNGPRTYRATHFKVNRLYLRIFKN